MPDSDEYGISPEHEKLGELLSKIMAYQRSLPDGRAVELDELSREGVLSLADFEFLTSHSVTYKPHRLSDFHALDMFHMPNAGGGCAFIGPGGPPLSKRRAPLRAFQPVVESFLELPRPDHELLLHIEIAEDDGMAVAPKVITFGLRGVGWHERLPALRAIAAEFGFGTVQDEMVQGAHRLTFNIGTDAAQTAAATVALLSRGCGFTGETEIVYSAGALDESQRTAADDSRR
jgi:hypothetical protein